MNRLNYEEQHAYDTAEKYRIESERYWKLLGFVDPDDSIFDHYLDLCCDNQQKAYKFYDLADDFSHIKHAIRYNTSVKRRN